MSKEVSGRRKFKVNKRCLIVSVSSTPGNYPGRCPNLRKSSKITKERATKATKQRFYVVFLLNQDIPIA